MLAAEPLEGEERRARGRARRAHAEQIAADEAMHAHLAALRLSATLLRPGRGRLVVVNPLRAAPPDAEARRRLELVGHATVDLGLRRDCRVEVWRRTEGP